MAIPKWIKKFKLKQPYSFKGHPTSFYPTHFSIIPLNLINPFNLHLRFVPRLVAPSPCLHISPSHLSKLSSPRLPIQAPVMYSLRKVFGFDIRTIVEVGNGTRYFQDSVVSAG